MKLDPIRNEVIKHLNLHPAESLKDTCKWIERSYQIKVDTQTLSKAIRTWLKTITEDIDEKLGETNSIMSYGQSLPSVKGISGPLQ